MGLVIFLRSGHLLCNLYHYAVGASMQQMSVRCGLDDRVRECLAAMLNAVHESFKGLL